MSVHMFIGCISIDFSLYYTVILVDFFFMIEYKVLGLLGAH